MEEVLSSGYLKLFFLPVLSTEFLEIIENLWKIELRKIFLQSFAYLNTDYVQDSK